jgi:hypothetical protein
MMRTLRTAHTVGPALALAVAAALAGCSSSSSSGAASVPAPALPTATVACADVAMTATHLTTSIHYVALDVGTTNDSTKYREQIDRDLGALVASAPACHPGAVKDLAAFSAAVAAMEGQLAPGNDAAAVAAKKAALATVRSTGSTAWTAMSLPTVAWENVPEQ